MSCKILELNIHDIKFLTVTRVIKLEHDLIARNVNTKKILHKILKSSI